MNLPLKTITPFGALKVAAISLAAAAIDENISRPYAPKNAIYLGPTAEAPDNVIPDHILRDMADFNVEGFVGTPICWCRGEGEQSKPGTLFKFVPQLIVFSYGTLMSSDSDSVLQAVEGGDATTPNSTVEVYGTVVDEAASLATKNARDGRLIVFDWRRQMARNQQNKDDADKRTEFELVDRIGVGYVPGERENTTVTHPKQSRMKSVLHSVGIALSSGKLGKPEGMSDEDFQELLAANAAYWREHWAHTTVSQTVQNLDEGLTEGRESSITDKVTTAVTEAAQAPKIEEEELQTV